MVAAGLRVIRGPGWSHGDADDGEGHVGTVVHASDDGTATVTWDGGQQVIVKPGSRDLRVLDNAPVGISHQGVTCDECHETNIVGMRWKCAQCPDYDLCSLCYFNDGHDGGHQFIRYETPKSPPNKMEERNKSKKIRVMGIFPEATVVRGQDWEWSNQDGGKGQEGVVTELLTPGVNSARSTVRVMWNSGGSNVYRVGYKGKVDIQYTEESPGGECYPQHLPVFDAKTYKQMALVPVLMASQQDSVISDGDRVYVELPRDKVQQLRQTNNPIAKVLGREGVVQGIVGGNAIVAFGHRKYQLSQTLLTKVSNFSVGDRVRVTSDEEKVMTFQEGHGGYIKDMRPALGKVGEVVKVDGDGDVVVQFDGGRNWCFNPACLTHAQGQPVDFLSEGEVSDDSDDSDEEDESGLSVLGQLMGTITLAVTVQARQEMGDLVFLKAIIDNDVPAVKQMLQREPRLVGASEKGAGALHIAANQGHLEITKILVENGAKLNDLDMDEGTPLMVGMKHDAIADYLIKKGADVTVANRVGQTAGHRAAAYGHVQILRLLMSRGADFNVMDKDGDTPFHDAISESRTAAAEVLVGWPKIDLRRKNKKGFNLLEFAAFKGEAAITDVLVRMDRSLVNEQKEDGFTALHVAAINNHTDVMKVLIEKGKAIVDMRTQKKQTPLHLASEEAYMDAVQLLLKHGADVNAKDCDGDRPFHAVMASHTGRVQGGDLLLLLLLGVAPEDKEEEQVRIACYLLQAGADPEARNNLGKTALDVCGNENITEAVRRFLAANPGLTSPSQRPQTLALARERSVVASDLCRKCCQRWADILLVPCGHKAVCRSCCSSLRACPQCRGFIKSMHDESGNDLKKKCSVM